ncbi:hypothetical protein BCR33DRAFT_148673 [Rhizoclosmatium globosum]|uniref:Uncharacterized protein n=1 Tax=Rhizoclosmatium globosum TaxID=329046 RepID=A0A1Y2AJX4_9FUNG|nr:hypothetical protein BCR33DRAFT_148673 [Rhizoclosmatium globosum]|eukprot:ORY22816.1 hypothetical protein BCR33DRAFT_148673 [Rhizoclosmatium globosum]
MRMEMRKVTNELQRWREEYELAINGALQSDTLTDAPATLSPTTHESFDFPEKPDIALRRAQSTAALASSFGADDAAPGSQSSNTAAAMAQLLRRYPPVAPSSTSSLKDSTPATSMYPKPQYPTHLLPRRKQSSPQLTTPSSPSSPSSTTPQRANSMPTAALSITTHHQQSQPLPQNHQSHAPAHALKSQAPASSPAGTSSTVHTPTQEHPSSNHPQLHQSPLPPSNNPLQQDQTHPSQFLENGTLRSSQVLRRPRRLVLDGLGTKRLLVNTRKRLRDRRS